MPTKTLIGRVEDFYSKPSVIAVTLEGSIAVGDRISIEKGDSVIEQEVRSMQIEHQDVKSAKKGDSVGIKTDQPVTRGSKVYRLS